MRVKINQKEINSMTPAQGHSDTFDIAAYIDHHIADNMVWELPFLPSIPLSQHFTLHGLMLVLCALLLILIFCVAYKKNDVVPRGFTAALEAIVLFIRDEIVYPNLGKEDGRRLMPVFCTLFFFILGLNLMGMIPIFSTATANIYVTGALASIALLFMTVGAMWKHGPIQFFKGLIPSGVPWPIAIILLPIEIISLFTKAMALMIRLFANLMAGHIVIFAILGMIVSIGAVALPMLVLALLINVIELFVAFLQAYVFTLLSAIFIGQTFHPEH